MKRMHDKSGAPADLIDLYSDDSSFDVYQDRWEFADHMNFYIPACARSASTVSMGNASSSSNMKRRRMRADYDVDNDFDENVMHPSFPFS